jgi:AcrR family transcriptional regulator
MGVAQGTVYYYFKSKEEILEGLINCHIVMFVSEIFPMIYSGSIVPPLKFNLVMQAIFYTIRYTEGNLLFGFLYDDRLLVLWTNYLVRQIR